MRDLRMLESMNSPMEIRDLHVMNSMNESSGRLDRTYTQSHLHTYG